MKLIVGLGNPGKEYAQTRHNIGFIVIDHILETLKLELKVDSKMQVAYVKTNIANEQVIFAKPLTFMNLSGNAVVNLMNYYKVSVEDILIILDDTALPLGKIRIRETGSHGGQNGLKNIILQLSSSNFKRLRIGIGNHDTLNKADYVLGKLSKTELTVLTPSIKLVNNAILDWIQTNNFQHIMTNYNTPQA